MLLHYMLLRLFKLGFWLYRSSDLPESCVSVDILELNVNIFASQMYTLCA